MAGSIAVGQEVSLSVEAYPDRTFTGKISRIDPSVDSQSRSFEAEALVDNKQGVLKPGFFVKASVPSNKSESVLSIPNEAVSYSYGVFSVYVIEDGRLKQKEVKPGDRIGKDVEILSGLKAGDQVGLPGSSDQQLRDGAKVKAGR
jgi:membrane fusion protein (multidrug efflux system)